MINQRFKPQTLFTSHVSTNFTHTPSVVLLGRFIIETFIDVPITIVTTIVSIRDVVLCSN